MKLGPLLTMTFAGAVLLAGSASATEWRVPGHFPTIQAAIDSAKVHDGDVILVGPGRRAGAVVTKAVTIEGRGPRGDHAFKRNALYPGHGETTIDDGPVANQFGKAGFYFPGNGKGSGAAITGFFFAKLAFAVFSRGANDVSITDNSIASTLQGITNWGYGSWGNRWEITANRLLDLRTDCGGGIGIMVGDFKGGALRGNRIARNTVEGRLYVPAGDCGGYNAPGILLYADFRDGAAGGTVERNVVSRNRVYLHVAGPGTPGLVTLSAIELSDSRNDSGIPVVDLPVRQNVVNYNDLRGTAVPFFFTPAETEGVNTIDHNFTGPFPDLLMPATPATGAAPVR